MAIGEASGVKGNRSTALGNSSSVTADRSVALGADSMVTASGSVALGVGSVADQANTVSVGSATSQRRIVNMAAGTVSANSTDAINGSQLHAVSASMAAGLGGGSTVNPDGTVSAPSYSVDGKTVSNTGEAIANIDSRTTQNTKDVAQNTSDIADVQKQLTDGSIGLVQQDATSKVITVAKGLDGTTVDFTGTDGARMLSGVRAGALSDTSTEAVNGSQLYATNQAIANASRYFKAGGLEDGSDDAIAAARSVAVGAGASANQGGALTSGWNNPAVSSDGPNTDTSGVAIGAHARASLGGIALGDTAVTDNYSGVALGAYTVAGSHGTAVGAGAMAEGTDSSALGFNALAANGSAVAIGNFSAATGDRSMALGSKANAQAANSVALGANSVADLDDTISVGNATLKRQITNVAAGTLSASSTDAVNGAQLYTTNQNVTANTASIAANTKNIETNATNVAANMTAITSIDGRVTNVEGSITNLTQQLDGGGVGLVQQDATSKTITVAKDLDGKTVDFSGTDGVRTLSGVAAGAVAASSKEAVNGGQLYANSASVAAGLGGGASVNADGTISAPSYTVGGTTAHSVGDAVTNLDDRVTQNTTDLTKLQNQVGDVGTQLSGAVQYDRNVDGSVNFGSVTLGASLSSGPVVLTNVANGTSQYDAVNYGQLSALQGQVTDLNGQMKDLGSQVSNIQVVTAVVPSPDSNNAAVANAAMPGTGAGSTVAGAGAAASGDNATAIGANAAATGVNSTAIGAGSQAGNANSVALGQGSVTDRDNSVSVGSAGNQRQITNVAAGTANTDAVNVGQMNSSIAQGVQQANSYTDQRVNATNQAINNVAKNAYAGIAAAMAMPNMTPSGPGKTIVAAGGATYKGGSAAAVGATHRSQNNKWLVNAAMSVTSTGDAGVRAQVGYEF